MNETVTTQELHIEAEPVVNNTSREAMLPEFEFWLAHLIAM